MNKGVLSGLGPGDAPDVLSSDASMNALRVAGTRKELTGSASANNVDLIPPTDVSGFGWMTFQTLGTFTATVGFQVSNDGVNWFSPGLFYNLANAIYTSQTSSPTMGFGPLGWRYLRVRTTAYTSGTVSIVVELSPIPPANPYVVAWQAGNWQTLLGSMLPPGDAQSSFAGTTVASMSYNGASWDRLRIPNKFNTATATASGDTALWTPAASKKFRLMRYRIEVTNDAATSGGADIDVVLRDATTATSAAMSLYVPASGGTTLGSYSTGWVDLGNGFLSAAANNVLNINLSAALTSGKVRVVACGTEE